MKRIFEANRSENPKRKSADLRYIRAAAAVFAGIGLATAASCCEPYPEPEYLSRMLGALSEDIAAEQSCTERRNVLDKWLDDNGGRLIRQKTSFDEICRPGDRADYQCMAFQIIASARVEVALQGCSGDKQLAQSVGNLNRMAGTAIKIDR